MSKIVELKISIEKFAKKLQRKHNVTTVDTVLTFS
jgi:hypothetical protein